MLTTAGRALAGLLLFLPACAKAEVASPPEEMSYAEYRAFIAQTWCQRTAQCGLFSTAGHCLEFHGYDALYQGDWYIDAAIADGRLQFDRRNAALCAKELSKEVACREWFGRERYEAIAAACIEMRHPAQQPGDVCFDDIECVDGAYCQLSAPSCRTDSCCAGTCREYQEPKPLSRCQKNADCGSVDVCIPGGHCAIRQSVGGSCDDHDDCRGSLACGSDGVCILPERIGDRCADLCVGAAVCDSGVCKERAPLRHTGEYCTKNGDCESYLCAYAVCATWAREGEPCDEVRAMCLGELFCNERFVCQAKARTGESCSTRPCVGRNSWFPNRCTNGICLGLGGDGDPCTSNDHCSSYTCENRICVPPARICYQ